MRRSLWTVVASLSLALFGAGPTTKPTTRPTAAKPPIPKSWLTTVNQTYHFQYRVPPQWKAKQQSDALAAFEFGGSPKVPPALFTVVVGPCHEATTEANAAGERKSIAENHPNAKITKDQRSTLGDKPAWLLVFDDTQTTTVTTVRGNRPPQVTEIQHISRTSEVARVEGNLHYYVTFQATAPQFAANQPTVQQVLDSFTWSEPPATK